MTRKLDILGKRFGKLVATEELPKHEGRRRWRLRCDCGGERIAMQASFASGGKMRCCGCTVRTTQLHGLSTTPEYRHWINMISRCENPNTPGFEHYGGRGIRICKRWRESFSAFLEDVGQKPFPRASLDRIDVNGHYDPGNVRWAERKTQARNTRVNRVVCLDGRRMTLAEAVESRGLKYNTVLYRILRGKSPEEALR